MNKSLIGLIGSTVLTLLGVILRLGAHWLAWPTQYSYSGPAPETPWGTREIAIGQIGLAVMLAGILIFVATYFHWLSIKQSDQ